MSLNECKTKWVVQVCLFLWKTGNSKRLLCEKAFDTKDKQSS